MSESAKNIFFVFPGQGSQYPGMGSDVCNEYEVARKIYAQAMKHKQLRKLAVVGKSMVFKTVLSFILLMVGKTSTVKWFDDKSEALAWLKE